MLTLSRSRISRKLFVLFVPVALILGTVAAPVVQAAGLSVADLNHGVSALDLAQSLAGPGVTVSNETFTGTGNAGGTFTGGTGIIGFESGIILGTGGVQTLPPIGDLCGGGGDLTGKGVEGPNECIFNTTDNQRAGDADLTTLAGVSTFDAAVLQFDFVPQFGSLQFRYVFSSDEYAEYANTEFNDTFAFFVNGVNCALVPGTTLPVSINTINGGNPLGTDPQHPQFYRDNSANPTINAEPDGFTTVLTCNATVNAGVSNHMKLAIADGTDHFYDSNVFLEAGSLISGTQITTSLSGGGQSGVTISVPIATAVHDTATLSGVNVASATGTVTYAVFDDTACTNQVGDGGTKTVTAGVVPDSDPLIFSAGTYYWRASYSGDGALNNADVSPCGDVEGAEILTVTPPTTGTLIIVKNTTGGDGTFNFTVEGPSPITPSVTTTSGTGTTGPITVFTGPYTITETGQPTWTQTAASCDDGGTTTALAAGAPLTFSVAPGATVTCTFANETAGGGLTGLSDAHLWVGLRNSDDQGTQFDVKVELFRNLETTPLATGLTRCVTGLTRNAASAKNVTVPWDPFLPVSLSATDDLYIKISTRIGTTATGAKCPGPGGSHNNAVALRFYYDAANRNSNFDATIGTTNSNLYFHSDGGGCDKPAATTDSKNVTNRFLDTNPSAGTLVKCKDSGKLNFNGGNPYTEVGRWNLP